MQTPHHHSPKLKESVLTRIEQEHVCPRSRWFFQSVECGVWLAWLATVVVGAVAVAVSLYVMLLRGYALFEATHEQFVWSLLEYLPYLWLGLFVVMIVLAVYHMKHTKRGYRYPLSHIMVSSCMLSVVGGLGLHALGFGYAIDRVLGDTMPMYRSQAQVESRLWDAPADGRLVGALVHRTSAPSTTVIFADVSGRRWQLEIMDLHAIDAELLASGQTVRVLGMQAGEIPRVFHACGVFPWIFDRQVSVAELSAERQEFVSRMSAHKKNPKQRLASLQSATYASSSRRAPTGICADIAVTKRIERTLVAP